MFRHTKTSDCPPERPKNLPILDSRLINLDTRDFFIPAKQIFIFTEPPNRTCSTKTPGVYANPTQIPHGVTYVCQFPIEYCNDAFFIDHEIAISKIIVNKTERLVCRQILEQPLRRVVNHRPWGVEIDISVPGLLNKLPRGNHGKLFL